VSELNSSRNNFASAYTECQDQNTPEDRRQLLMKSLEFKQMDSRRMTIKENYKKTCQWFLSHPDYKAWLDPIRLTQHHGFLWISGKPGAGKSTMMKFAYSNMKGNCRGNVKTAAFFFNARGESLEKSTSGMYRSLLLQLLKEYRDLQTVLDNPDILPQNQEGCPLNTLKDLFRDAISALGHRRFTCFVDALDECDEQQIMDMVEFFEDLGELTKGHDIQFRICFSSRHYPYIVLKHGIRFTLEDQSGHAEDLAIYITSRLRINDPSLIKDLLPELLRKAAGVFMWVVLVVRILNDEDRRGGLALRKRLAEIPSDLSKLFKDILTRDTKDVDSLLLCIRWIIFAERPLQPEEFRHALWSGLSLKNMVDSQIPAATHEDNLDKVVISYSKGLAEITKSRSRTVQFIHESVRDFLLKENGLRELWPGMETDWESSSHEELKKCCRFYLTQPPVSSSIETLAPRTRFTKRQNILNKFPFLKYAAQSILYHANAAAEVVVQDEFLTEFPLACWIKMNNHFEKHKIREYTLDASLFYVFADKGYPNLVRTWLKEDPQIHIYGERYCYPLFAALATGNRETVAALLNSTSSIMSGTDITEGLRNRSDLRNYKNRTPLSWAAQEGRLGMTKLLIKKGANINIVDQSGSTALHYAIQNGYEAVAKLLIENGADSNISDQFGSTALHYAIQNGYEAVAKLLIENGVDINIVNQSRSTALHYAIQNGYEAVAKLLIEKGVNINIVNQSGSTALHYAVQNGYEDLAKLLIEKGVDSNIADQSGSTALHYAIQNGYEDLAKLLIKKGVDSNIADQSGSTALHYAIQNGYEAVAKLLIEKGVDSNIVNQSGSTALRYAIQNGHEAVAKLLIEKGADSNIIDQFGSTALHYAAGNGYEAIARLLIKKEVDIDTIDQSGSTALHYAIQNGHKAVVKLLIENSADVNILDQSGSTALHYAAGNGYDAIARLLIEKGVDINIIDQFGSVALHYAIQNGYEAIAKLLIEKGADINIIDQFKSTALHYAAGNGYDVVVRLLIKKGADINIINQSGSTALRYASGNGYDIVVRILIENGADINVIDQSGSTALCYASGNGYNAVVRLLIENGADVNIIDQSGSTALHYAIQNGYEAVAKLLIENGVEVNKGAIGK
jgi:ankyrin repeat protein